MHGGSKTHPRRGSAAAPAGEEGTLLAAGPRDGLAATITSTLAALPRRAATSPVPATDAEHSEPGGAGARGRALSGGSPRGGGGAGAGPRGAGGPGFELLLGLPKNNSGTKLKGRVIVYKGRVILYARNKESKDKSG